MHMYFWWDYQLTNYLFNGLSISSVGGTILLCLIVATMSFLFELLRYLQARQRQKELKLRSVQLKMICPSESSTLLPEDQRIANSNDQETTAVTLTYRILFCTADVMLWFFLQNLSYILMLSVMLYNGWLFVSAVLGGGLGYFTFGQHFMKLNLQNCQIIRDTWCMQKCGESEFVNGERNGESTPALLETACTSSASPIICTENSDIVTVANVHKECHN